MDEQRPLEIINIGQRAPMKSPEEIIKMAEISMVPMSIGGIAMKPRFDFVIALDNDAMLLAQLQDLRTFYSTPGRAHYVIRGIDIYGNSNVGLMRAAYKAGPYGMLFVVKGMLIEDDKIFLTCSPEAIGQLNNLLRMDWFRDMSSFIACKPYPHSVYADKLMAGEFGWAKKKQGKQ